MRWDKPIGIYLLLWPTLWALWIATNGRPTPAVFAIFVLGTIIMRAAGCVINDIFDRQFDGHVTRTQQRPLATGQITAKAAVILFIVLLGAAGILLLQLNLLTIKLGLLGAILSIIYPLMKRWIAMPQAVLGLAFAWGIPMAFTATIQTFPVAGYFLFLATFTWVIMYDTAYAMVDRQDDLQIGIRSSAILFGRYDVMVISMLQISTVLLLGITGWLANLGIFFYLSLLGASLLFIHQYRLIKTRNPTPCFQAFLNNHWVGLLIFVGLFCDRLYASI